MIIGSGRSGTTILYKLLAIHPELAWFSVLSNKYPGSKGWLRFHKLLDYRGVGKYMKKKIIEPTRFGSFTVPYLRPSEGEDIYASCGFDDGRRMTEEDYDEGMERKLKDLMKMHLEVTGKRRFINKRTANTQRLRLVNRMFPDAYYVHMIRDGRAVINSYLNVEWWHDTMVWWLGEKVSEWEKQGKDPVELAARQWRRNFEEIMANKGIFKRYMEVRYEDLTKDTRKEIGRILDFCELSFPESYKNLIPKCLPNMNYKWRQGLTKEQISTIEENTNDVLKTLGYRD